MQGQDFTDNVETFQKVHENKKKNTYALKMAGGVQPSHPSQTSVAQPTSQPAR